MRKYEEGSHAQEFSEIRPDRPKISECCFPLSFTLPNLFIWDPLRQYYDIFDTNPLVCEEHGRVVVPARWTNGSSNSLNPRVLLEDNGPALLIAREYYCKAGHNRHYIRSTDEDFLRYLCENYFIEPPFKLTHKCDFTLSFVKRLRSYISHGLSFNMFQSTYMEHQLEYCMEKKWEFRRHCDLRRKISEQSIQEYSVESTEELFSTFKDFVIGMCPSDDLLCDVFLKDSQDRKVMFEESMRLTSARELMADHTFKV